MDPDLLLRLEPETLLLELETLLTLLLLLLRYAIFLEYPIQSSVNRIRPISCTLIVS